MKVCTCCLELKDKSEFYKCKTNSDGLLGECKTCRSKHRRNNYLKNREHDLAKSKEWRDNNIERVHRVSKTYRENNKEKETLKAITWAKNNPDKVKIAQAKYCRNNPDKITAKTGKRRASKLNRTPSWISKEELNKIREVYKLARKLTKETGVVYHVDHIIPLQGRLASGLHTLYNLQVITAKDNLAKSNKLI
jgi:hypothetical protein